MLWFLFSPSTVHAHVPIVLRLVALGRTIWFDDWRQRVGLLELGQHFVQHFQRPFYFFGTSGKG